MRSEKKKPDYASPSVRILHIAVEEGIALSEPTSKPGDYGIEEWPNE